MQANPGLGTLIDGAIGDGWRTDPDRLAALREVGGDAGFAEGLAAVKRRNKARLAEVVREASGTGNMKFALNGALTIGTWDGANIEMAKAMGEDNMFVFGLRADAVEALKAEGYEPSRYIQRDPALARAIASVASGEFSPGDPQRYRHITDELQRRDGYLLMADFGDCVQAQARVDTLFGTPAR